LALVICDPVRVCTVDDEARADEVEAQMARIECLTSL
jgi:hypothetical protein